MVLAAMLDAQPQQTDEARAEARRVRGVRGRTPHHPAGADEVLLEALQGPPPAQAQRIMASSAKALRTVRPAVPTQIQQADSLRPRL